MNSHLHDYDSELDHLLALFRKHNALQESCAQVPMSGTIDAPPILTWVVEKSQNKDKSDANA